MRVLCGTRRRRWRSRGLAEFDVSDGDVYFDRLLGRRSRHAGLGARAGTRWLVAAAFRGESGGLRRARKRHGLPRRDDGRAYRHFRSLGRQLHPTRFRFPPKFAGCLRLMPRRRGEGVDWPHRRAGSDGFGHNWRPFRKRLRLRCGELRIHQFCCFRHWQCDWLWAERDRLIPRRYHRHDAGSGLSSAANHTCQQVAHERTISR